MSPSSRYLRSSIAPALSLGPDGLNTSLPPGACTGAIRAIECPREPAKEKPGIVSAIASDGAEKDGAEKGGDPSGVGGLMDIFDEEIVVDKQLETLNSWVEEVDAEELVDELRSLMEELGNLTNKI